MKNGFLREIPAIFPQCQDRKRSSVVCENVHVGCVAQTGKIAGISLRNPFFTCFGLGHAAKNKKNFRTIWQLASRMTVFMSRWGSWPAPKLPANGYTGEKFWDIDKKNRQLWPVTITIYKKTFSLLTYCDPNCLSIFFIANSPVYPQCQDRKRSFCIWRWPKPGK